MASHGVSRVAGSTVRTEETRQKEIRQISAYRDLVDQVNKKIAGSEYTLGTLDLITRLLNENPEYYTIWNHRRRVLESLISQASKHDSPSLETEDLIRGDLQLTFSLLRKFPKCYWIWNHRNWILQRNERNIEPEKGYQLWFDELQLVGKMLHVDSRNFHAWGYRRTVCQHLERMLAIAPEATNLSKGSPSSLTESEFQYTTRMIQTNLSNFSAWHHRSQLIPRLLDERRADNGERRKILEDELSLICTAINTDPFDQSIWYYQRYLMSTLSPGCPRHDSIALDLTNHDRQEYYAHEIDYIREIVEDESDCKWIYESLLYLARCYLEVDAGTTIFTTMDLKTWLGQLQRLDPLRRGRWSELEQTLGI